MDSKRKYGWYAAIVCVAAVAVSVYFKFDPASSGVFPQCPFLAITGLKCPGCGSQRALHCLLHLDIAGAARYNFLLVASVPLVVLLATGELLRRRCPRFYTALNNARLTIALLAIVIGWWILRNIINV